MDSLPKRPWYRLHWVTWIGMGFVLSSAVFRQFEERFVVESLGSLTITERFNFGWPLAYVEMEKFGPIVVTPTGPSPNPAFIKYEWFGWHLLLNCAICALLTGSTAYVSDAWLRSPKRSQFGVRHLMIVTFVVATLIALTQGLEVRYRDWEDFRMTWLLVSWSDMVNPLRWPLLLGLACTIYSLCWLTLALLRRAYSFVRGRT